MVIKPEDFTISEPDPELLKIINEKTFDDRVLYEKTSDFHQIKVVENEKGRFLHFQDTYQAGFINTPFYKGNLPYINYFTVPALFNARVKNILLIGFGSGKIVNDWEVLYDNLKSVDVVDIEENIFDIAQKYFNYKKSSKVNFYLQDGFVFLRNCKKKYDLIVVDAACDEGIDERFFKPDYLQTVKKCLKKKGIFVSNLCCSPDLKNPKNTLYKTIRKLYENCFEYVKYIVGNESDRIYYKCFFNIDKRVIDTTNLVLLSSDSPFSNDKKFDKKRYEKLNIDIDNYLKDLR